MNLWTHQIHKTRKKSGDSAYQRPTRGSIAGYGRGSNNVNRRRQSSRKGLGEPIGSLTQYKKFDWANAHLAIPIKDFVPLAGLNDLVFGGWDITPENAYETACNSGVLSENVLTNVRQN